MPKGAEKTVLDYKLTRYEEFDHEIERKVKKKLKGDRIDIQADWRQLLDNYGH